MSKPPLIKGSINDCTGHCFNTDYYLTLIKDKIALYTISEANVVENELQNITLAKRMGHHCTSCYDRSTQCLWFAYQLLDV
jgi:hypothetical protein